MLPFLKPKANSVGLIIKQRKPDDKPEQSSNEDQPDSSNMALEAIAEDLIQAVHAKDPKRVTQALKDAFEMLEMMPHEEVSHEQE